MVDQGSLIHARSASNGTFKRNRVGGSKAVGGGDYWRLVSATLLTLIVLPTLYLYLEDGARESPPPEGIS